MSWHRIYRPKRIQDLHLSNIRETLQSFMKKGQIPQVMLFAGPKGTGKTSSARIIGAMLNDPGNEALIEYQFFGKKKPKNSAYKEPSQKSEFNQKIYDGQSFVVQEMDAASNRGIDDIRDLKERVAIPPQDGKMTVYILDEAHMLTTAAFNALLKLLEEPPKHAVFILATTELHKIPATIKSRCSLLSFRQATLEEIQAALKEVLKAEKITYEDQALELIAQLAEGSFRDAVKILEMVAMDGKITLEKVESTLSASVGKDIKALVELTLDKDPAAVSELFESLRARNTDEKFFYKSLLNFLHTNLLQNLGIQSGNPEVSYKIALFLLKELSDISQNTSPIAHLHLELKILDLIERSSQKSGSGVKKNPKIKKKTEKLKPTLTPEDLSELQPNITSSNSFKEDSLETISTQEKSNPTQAMKKGNSQKLLQNWADFLKAVKAKNVTLEALLRSAKPIKGVNGTAEIAVYYKFHKEQLENPKFRNVIKECAISIAGGRVELEYQLSEMPTPSKAASALELPSETAPEDLAELAQEVFI